MLGHLRVGTKLTLLVLVPVCSVLAFTIFGTVSNLGSARSLRNYRTESRLAVSIARVAEQLSAERTAAVLVRLEPAAGRRVRLRSAQATTGAAFASAIASALRSGPTGVASSLSSARRRWKSVEYSVAYDTAVQIASTYSEAIVPLLDAVASLDVGAQQRAAERATDAYLAIVRALEAAGHEQVAVALELAPHGRRAPPGASPYETLEDAQLQTFSQSASGALPGAVEAVRYSAAGRELQAIREGLRSDPAATARRVGIGTWITTSGAMIAGLSRVEAQAARVLDSAVSRGVHHADTLAIRDLTLSLVLLLLVTAFGVALRRSITTPLRELSESARLLSAGELTAEVSYAGRDEIGEVADAFLELRQTAARLAHEIRAMNAAVRENRLERRADLQGVSGTWRQLLEGMNDTLTAVAEARSRRERAEHEAARVFEQSLDLLSVSSIAERRFMRVNPAFGRTLGYSEQELTSRPLLDFIHPDDRPATFDRMAALRRGDEVLQFENRYICKDGSVRWLQWSSRPMRDEGVVFSAARDVTDSRRTAALQRALRRLATLIARETPLEHVCRIMCTDIAGVIDADAVAVHRCDGQAVTIIASVGSIDGGWEPADDSIAAETIMERVGGADGPTRFELNAATGGAAGAPERNNPAVLAAPVRVRGALWGAITIGWRRAGLAPSAPHGEDQLSQFVELLAVALANADARAEIEASRARIIAAGDEARRRIERDLHDGVQQRLVSLGIDLRLAEQRAAQEGSPALRAMLGELAEGVSNTFDELHEIVRGIHPAILAHGPLASAVSSLARRSAVPVRADVPRELELSQPVKVAAYYVIAEALTNIAKHAQASEALVRVAQQNGVLHLTISDDGVGGATLHTGSGLVGLSDRVKALGGTLAVDSPAGRGTTLRVDLPTSANAQG